MAFPHALPTAYPSRDSCSRRPFTPSPAPLASLLPPVTPPSPIIPRTINLATFHPKTSFTEPPPMASHHADTAVLKSQLQVLGRLRSRSSAEGGMRDVGEVKTGEALQLGPAPTLLSVA